MNFIEPVTCISAWPSTWSFAAGAACYGAVQSGALSIGVRALRHVLPVNVYFGLVVILSLCSMGIRMLINKAKSTLSTLSVPSPAVTQNDVPIRSMRKPRTIETPLTSDIPKKESTEQETAEKIE